MKATQRTQRGTLVKILSITGDHCLIRFSNGATLNVLASDLWRTPAMKSDRWRYSAVR